MQILPILKGKSVRLYSRADLDSKEFLEFLERFRQVILREDVKVFFMLFDNDFFFCFSFPFLKDEIKIDQSFELAYFYACSLDNPIDVDSLVLLEGNIRSHQKNFKFSLASNQRSGDIDHFHKLFDETKHEGIEITFPLQVTY